MNSYFFSEYSVLLPIINHGFSYPYLLMNDNILLLLGW